jgi:FSR family fosmidomycin resistance protein-like MFS transporter
MSKPDNYDTHTQNQPSAVTTQAGGGASTTKAVSSDFQTGYVLTFSFAHALHDTYSAFLAPLLPTLIEKLSLSMTQAGLLDFARVFPALIQPFIGHLGDRFNLHYLVILAPAIAGTMMSLLGAAPSYAVLIALALAAGLGSAFLHALAPAMAGRFSGKKLGWGMGVWMVGGSVGFSVGPMVIVAVVDHLGPGGTPWLMIAGWIASLILFLRLRDTSTVPPSVQQRASLRDGLHALRPLMAPLVAISVVPALQSAAQSTFLPTLLIQQGESLWFAGISLTVLTSTGWVGALLGGAISDRLGRRVVLFLSMASAAVLMLVFLAAGGWERLPILLLMGTSGPASRAVLMALVQESCPDNRAMATGMLLAITFMTGSAASVAVGALGDLLGLRAAFALSALILLLGTPLVGLLPGSPPSSSQ